MSAPYEVIAAPFTAWLAPVGTTFPLIDAAPAGDWVLVGTSGNLNYTRAGVTVQHTQVSTKWRSLGDLGSRKIFRTEADLTIRLMLADVSLEQYALALNHNSITTVAPGGEAGYKKIGLTISSTVTQKALLVRGPSPYNEALNMQYEVPIAVQDSNSDVVYQLGDPAALSLQWSALVDTTAGSSAEYFGRLVASHLAAIS